MADRIIAGQNSPTSHDATDQQDAVDILENKLTQLRSLLNCCYGDEQELFDSIGARHRGNIMWIAADLADDIARLLQELLKRLHAMDQQKA
ncbi:hypothetical protein M2282_003573 [Variovorax boronicumulans]|uniref:hypothetical protein n=1 Tax=Variovorax boronicumulans TaxID=436515 RepID=UPI00247497F2|nr:hypothetical protein [Variovorax boronicumulans]MDH6168420.1 hypothetical protein [Variovorax boronicumulans]